MKFFFLTLILLLLCCPVHSSHFVSENAYRVLTESQSLLEKKQYTQAKTQLNSLINKSNTSDYEQALANKMLGVISIELNDYDLAAQYLEASLKSEQIPAHVAHELRYLLAQIYLFQEDYHTALDVIQRNLHAAAEPTANVCFLVASIYVGLNLHEKALVWVEKAVQQNVAQALKPGSTIQENYIALSIHLNISLENYLRTEQLLHTALQYFPERVIYWRQLVAIKLKLKKEKEALAVLKMATMQNILKRKHDIEQLAKLYIHVGLPFKAGTLLAAALRENTISADKDFYKLLTTAWNNAREYKRATQTLSKSATLFNDEELFIQAAYAYIVNGQWEEAKVAVNHVLQNKELKERLRAPAKAKLLQGIIYAQLEEKEMAETILIQCLEHEAVRSQAIQWLGYLDYNQ